MTEDEAKTKWCPFARVSEHGQEPEFVGPSNNRLHTEDDNSGGPVNFGYLAPGANCIGSACMAWRRFSKKGGFCGMAGKP